MKTGVKVHDAMSINPITVSPDLNVKKCAKMMIKKRVGSLIVTDKKKILGIITEKDIVGKIVAKCKNPSKILAKKVMTRRVKTIKPTTDIYDAVKYMKRKKIRRLPVVNKKELVGMLTMNDIMKIQPYLYDYMKEKFKVISMRKKKEHYIEGECESCGNYTQLKEVNGRFLCPNCMDEEGLS